jgi:hypothetical protein
LGRSVAVTIDLLAPVARETRAMTLGCSLLATDATGLPVLDEDVPDGIRNGTMWCWVGDGRWVSFFYAPNGDSDSVRAFLGKDLCVPVPRTPSVDARPVPWLARAGT